MPRAALVLNIYSSMQMLHVHVYVVNYVKCQLRLWYIPTTVLFSLPHSHSLLLLAFCLFPSHQLSSLSSPLAHLMLDEGLRANAANVSGFKASADVSLFSKAFQSEPCLPESRHIQVGGLGWFHVCSLCCTTAAVLPWHIRTRWKVISYHARIKSLCLQRGKAMTIIPFYPPQLVQWEQRVYLSKHSCSAC